jgi:hypothetical protein
MRARSLPVFLATLLVVNAPGIHLEANGQPALPTFPRMDLYNPSQICGKQGMRWNPKELPPIGCFGLSSGESASGTIADHELVVAVDSKGKEICKVGGVTVAHTLRTSRMFLTFGGLASSLHFASTRMVVIALQF